MPPHRHALVRRVPGFFSSLSLVTLIFSSAPALAEDIADFFWRGEAVSQDGNPPDVLGGPWTGSGNASNPEHLIGRIVIETVETDQGTANIVTYGTPQAGDNVYFSAPDAFFRPVGGQRTVSLNGLPTGLGSVDFGLRDAVFSSGSIDAQSIDIANPDESFLFASYPNQMTLNGTDFSAGTVSMEAGEILNNAPDPAAVQVDPDTDLSFNGGRILATDELSLRAYGTPALFNPHGGVTGEIRFDGTQLDSDGTLVVNEFASPQAKSDLNLILKELKSTVKGDVQLNFNEDARTRLTIEGASADVNWASAGGVTQLGILGETEVAIKNGASLNSNNTLAALGENAKTTVNVDGAHWTLGGTPATSSSIGGFGQAEVTAVNAAEITSGNLTIGLSNTAEGKTSSVNLHDTAKLTVNGFLEIGRTGQGELHVNDQSSVEVNGLVLMGNMQDSVGRAQVESGNQLKSTGTFEVGRNGDAELIVQKSGHVEAGGDSYLGTYQTGYGKVTLDGADTLFDAKGNLNIGNGSTAGPTDGNNGEGEFTIKNGGELRMAEGKEIRIGRNEGSKGKLTLSGTEAKITQQGEARALIKVGVDGEGELVLENGFKLDSDKYDVRIGQNGSGHGKLTARGQGTEVVYQNATVGEGGIGSFTVEDQATATVQEKLVIGESNRDGVSELVVKGQGSKLRVGQQITVGETGKGTLRVEQGGLVELIHEYFQKLVLGEQQGSDGTLEIKGKDATVDFDVARGELVIGDRGKGTLKLSDGGLFILTSPSADGIRLARNQGSESNVEISGREGDTRSRLGIDTDLYIGEKGTANVRVSNGGLLQGRPGADILTVVGGSDDTGPEGDPNKGKGSVTVTGADSEWQVTGTLVIGNAAGEGTVKVENGGRLKSLGTTQSFVLGGKNGEAKGSLLVSGEGSEVTYKNEKLLIGQKGSGEIRVEKGGKLKSDGGDQKVSLSGGADLAEETPPDSKNAKGTVTITGQGSEWSHRGTILVGTENAGLLKVEDQARLSVSGEAKLELHRGSIEVNSGATLEAPNLNVDRPGEGETVRLAIVGEEGKRSKLITKKANIGQYAAVTVGKHAEWDLTGGTGGVDDGDFGKTALEIHGTVVEDDDGEDLHTAFVSVTGEGARVNATGRDIIVDRGWFGISDGGSVKVNNLLIDTLYRSDSSEFRVNSEAPSVALEANEIRVGENGRGNLQVVAGRVRAGALKIGGAEPDPNLPVPGGSGLVGVFSAQGVEISGTTGVGFPAGSGRLDVGGRFKTNHLAIAEEPGNSVGFVSAFTPNARIEARTVTVGNAAAGDGELEAIQGGTIAVSQRMTINKFGTVKVGPTDEFGRESSVTVGAGAQAIAGAVTVGAGGMLGGSGKIIGNLYVGGTAQPGFGQGGTVSPGNSPGLLTVEGDFILGAGGVLDLEVAGLADGFFDQLVVTGLAELQTGSIINVHFIDGFAPKIDDIFDFIIADLLSVGSPEALMVNVTGLRDYDFLPVFTDDGFSLVSLQDAAATPIGSTLVLLFVGLSALWIARCRINRVSAPVG